MPLFDDLLADGVSLSSGLPADVQAGACLEGPWQWPYLMADQRGDFPVFQGFDGVGYTDQPYAPLTLPVYLALSAPECTEEEVEQSDDSWAWLNEAYETVQRTCKPDRQITLTRRRSLPDGDVSHTAAAKLLRITPARDGRDTLRLAIEFLLLRGIWHGESVGPVALDGDESTNLTVDGTTRTHRISVHVAAGTQGFVVENTTNGYALGLDNTTDTPTGGVDIDVEARTAAATVSGADWSRYLVWPKAHPLRLDVGLNALQHSVVTGPSSGHAITYSPAYL